MHTQKVSIIIPVYNVEKYVGETIDSVLAQTYQDIEIIIVNDGSTDQSLSILKEYAQKDPRIQIINQSNKGLSGARNSGLAVASGEYLCIFDADDIMLPEKIASQVDYLQQHPDIDFVYSDLVHFFDGTKNKRKMTNIDFFSEMYERLLVGNFINPNTVLFRRKVYDICGGFDESLRSSEEWDYWLHILNNGFSFGYLSEILTLYRIRKTSLSFNFSTMYETAIKVLDKQKSLWDAKKITKYNFVITEGIIRRKRLLALSYVINRELVKFKNLNISVNFLWKIIFLILRIVPRKIGLFLLMQSKKFKFYKSSKKV